MRLRAFGVPWFTGESYELHALPFLDWSLLVDYHLIFNIPEVLSASINWVPYYQSGGYDIAVLHLDMDCIDPHLQNCRKRQLYEELDEVIQDIPKVVIVHGIPRAALNLDREQACGRLNALVGENNIVVASETSLRYWGRGDVIVPGMSSDDAWLSLPKEPRVVTAVGLDGLPRSSYEFLEAVRVGLAANDIVLCHIGVNYIAPNWENFRNYLGRSQVYIAPRTQFLYSEDKLKAMLSACCVISGPWPTRGSLAEEFEGVLVAEDGPQAVALVQQLINNPDRATKVGEECRMSARRLLDWPRYVQDWESYLTRLIGSVRV